MIDIIVILIYLFANYCIGKLFLNSLHDFNRLEKVFFSFLFGIGLMSVLFYSINNLIGIRLTVGVIIITYLISIVLFFLVFNGIIKRKMQMQNIIACKTNMESGDYSWTRILLIILILVILITIFITPNRGWDPFLYHLPYAQQLLKTGFPPQDISECYGNIAYAYPPLIFYFYGQEWIILNKTEHVLPRVTHILFFMGIILILFKIAYEKMQLSKQVAIGTCFLFISFPAIQYELFRQNTDIPIVFYSLCFIYCFIGYLENNKKKYLLFFAGVSIALACWVKYTAIIIALSLFLSFIYIKISRIKTKNKEYIIKAEYEIIFIIGIFLLFFCPLLIVNYMKTGNPVFPVFNDLLNASHSDDWTLKWIRPFVISNHYFAGMRRSILNVISSIGFPLALFSLFAKNHKYNDKEKFIISLALFFTILWAALLGHPNSGDPQRFYFFGFAILSLIAVNIIDNYLSLNKKKLFFLVSVLLISLGSGIAYLIIKGKFKFKWINPNSLSNTTLLIEYNFKLLGYICFAIVVLIIAYSYLTQQINRKSISNSMWSNWIYVTLSIPLIYNGLTISDQKVAKIRCTP